MEVLIPLKLYGITDSSSDVEYQIEGRGKSSERRRRENNDGDREL